MLELLASSPGTGKTSTCIELFKSQILKSKAGIDSRAYFILPSREHADRIQNLVLKKDVPGIFNAHIMTINDFTSKLLGVLSGAGPSDTLRRRLIKEILLSARFDYFEEVKNIKGFHHLLADAVKEFKASLLSIQEFENLAQPLLKRPAFRAKFRDFSVVFKNYEAILKKRGLAEPEDRIANLVNEKAASWDLDLVIFDGFYHFTRAQRLLIGAVSGWSSRTLVTLTLPPDAGERRDVFLLPLKTYAFLKDAGFEQPASIFKDNHRVKDPVLLHLEKNIFTQAPQIYDSPAPSLSIYEASSMTQEIQMIARRVKQIYREPLFHLSDICLILRDVSRYKDVISSVFKDFGIPVNIHERVKLIEQGLAVVVYRFFNLFVENWEAGDLFYVLKSGYLAAHFKPEGIFKLESLAARQNVVKDKQKWRELLESAEMEPLSKDALGWVFSWIRRFGEARKLDDFVRCFREFLGQFAMPDATQEGKETEYAAVERQSLVTLQEIVQNAARHYHGDRAGAFDTTVFIKELQELMEAALFSMKPKSKNRVQVYDVVMALPKEYKAVFVVGLLEGQFPQAVIEDPLFKDDERKAINKKELILEERLWRSTGERYFFYMAVTRASQQLYLSYSLYDPDGKPALRSFFIEEVLKCFEPSKVSWVKKEPDEVVPPPHEWENEFEITQGLSWMLFGEERGRERAHSHRLPANLFNAWIKKDHFADLIDTVRSGDGAEIHDERIRKLFAGFDGPFSASRLETYATCAFRYFAKEVLRLGEPLEGREAAEMGSLLHKTLEEFYKEIPEDKRRGCFESEERVRETEKILHEKLKTAFEKSSFMHEPLYRQTVYFEEMRSILSEFSQDEREAFRDRGMLPAYFELGFGAPEPGSARGLDYLRIANGKKEILVRGRIDRVDLFDGGRKALIVDYKLSKDASKLKERLRKKMELQIPLYILAVERLLHKKVIGGELHTLKKGKKDGIVLESERETLAYGPTKKMASQQELDGILGAAEELTRSVVNRLQGADISVRSKSCEYCAYSGVCRFEKWRLIYSEEGGNGSQD